MVVNRIGRIVAFKNFMRCLVRLLGMINQGVSGCQMEGKQAARMGRMGTVLFYKGELKK